ncbi:MAG: TraB/GumN family protein [Candidatus Diapherotrites archaeon]|nr:TraB/GumN family protein [Candidatus Diapherotrites archaeon]
MLSASSDIERLFFEGREIVLVGTAHISRKSAELVAKTIEEEKPDVIGVELDAERFFQLKSGAKWREMDLFQLIKEGKTYLLLLNILLSNMQRKLGQQIGVTPGEEMIEAIGLAEKGGVPVQLLDRSVKITLKRAMDRMSLKEKFRLGVSVISGIFSEHPEITADTVEELKNEDVMNKLISELSRELPSVKEVLVDERDLFIANRILDAPGKKIVAVVGKGHMAGIKRLLDRRRDVSGINRIEEKKSRLGFLKFAIPALFIALLGAGFLLKGPGTTLQILAYWILVTGGFSALGVILARGHPASIATAFLASPITTLHPLLASGWFAGAVEAKFNAPKVRDFEGLNSINSFSDFYSNRVTRILIVTAYANIGATIGVIIALPAIVSLFG